MDCVILVVDVHETMSFDFDFEISEYSWTVMCVSKAVVCAQTTPGYYTCARDEDLSISFFYKNCVIMTLLSEICRT